MRKGESSQIYLSHPTRVGLVATLHSRHRNRLSENFILRVAETRTKRKFLTGCMVEFWPLSDQWLKYFSDPSSFIL